ncbi:hypothetical protein ACFVYA_22340 [Amycolatopsis sp. NPDC058278]|uniref:hypothetical protein n=1 Tax=Amycolatopsis sp. NPDC058278 TaxID=3346417 RepID=UPI0036D7FFE4
MPQSPDVTADRDPASAVTYSRKVFVPQTRLGRPARRCARAGLRALKAEAPGRHVHASSPTAIVSAADNRAVHASAAP